MIKMAVRQKHTRHVDERIGASARIKRQLKSRQDIAGFDAATTDRIDRNIFVPKIDHRNYRGARNGRLICRFFL